ncbi:SAG1386/EF1546 family surface-associated protein [Limosilactobacillus antri]|nr:SAG1386/EF1546 family surface-associated protein [Limosilactobacillus antri]KRK59626.1 hypothetical protein FC31_GL000563 [Limosilactobacillus antri DSM 16041]
MSEKREESRRQNDELWDKKFTDNEDLDRTGHLSRTERRKQEAHSSTITTVLVVLIIVLAASPLIFWLNNKQSFNHPARTEQTAAVSSKKKATHRLGSATSSRSTSKPSTSAKTSSSANGYSQESARTNQSAAGQTMSNRQSTAANRQYVVVRRGQSVYRIAAQNGLTAQELARLNNISINTPIHPGQQLRVR